MLNKDTTKEIEALGTLIDVSSSAHTLSANESVYVAQKGDVEVTFSNDTTSAIFLHDVDGFLPVGVNSIESVDTAVSLWSV